MIYEPSKFCCKNHQIESTKSRERFLSMRLRGHAAEFEVAIAQADVYKNGYLPRELLSLLATIQCDKLLRAATTKVSCYCTWLHYTQVSPAGGVSFSENMRTRRH